MNVLLLYLTGTLLRAGVVALLLGGWSRVGKVRSWMVLLLLGALLLPFGFEGWRGESQARQKVTAVASSPPVLSWLEAVERGKDAIVAAPEPSRTVTNTGVTGLETYSISIGWAGWIGVAYIIVTLFWGAYRLGKAGYWLCQVKCCPLVTDERLLRLFADARGAVGMNPDRYRNLSLRNSGKDGVGPACCGWRHGIVLLPEEEVAQMDALRLRMLLMHELEHLRRGHHRWSWIVWGLESVFWFNPGIRILVRGWKNACELECDEAVGRILRLTPQERAVYAGLLLDLAAGASVSELPAPGASRDARQLKQRMTELVMKTNKIDRIWCSAAILAVVALIGLWVPMGSIASGVTALDDLDAKVAALRPPELETNEWTGYYSRYKTLINRGEYEEALVNIVWFWEHILEYEYAMTGVRLSFLTMEWKKLGELYPPAHAEMIRQRDRAAAYLKAGNWKLVSPWVRPDGSIRDTSKEPPQSEEERSKAFLLERGDTSILVDVVHLSSVLGDSEYVVTFAEFVEREQPQFFAKSFLRIKGELLDAGGYALASKYIPDLAAAWDKLKLGLSRMFQIVEFAKERNPNFKGEVDCLARVNITRTEAEQLVRLARWQKKEELAARIEREMDELEKEYRLKIKEYFSK